MNSFNKLLEIYKSQAAIARAFGLTPNAITLWKSGGIPPGRALQAEKLTNGKVKASAILRDYVACYQDRAA